MHALRTSLVLVAVIAAAALIAIPVAIASGSRSPTSGMMGSPSPSPSTSMMPTPQPTTTGDPGSWCGGGIWNGSGTWAGTGMWGTGFGRTWLETHPQAFQAWLDLMAKHRAALRSWYDTYKTDLRSDAAQQALNDLWQSFWNDMKSFYQTYAAGAVWTCPDLDMWGGWGMMGGGMMGGGWDASHMWGSGYGASWMMGHPAAFGGWLGLHRKQATGMASWWKTYSSAPTSAAAQAALTTMHKHHRAQVRTWFNHHHLRVTTTRMRYGAGGWMGLGGMWGGWGW